MSTFSACTLPSHSLTYCIASRSSFPHILRMVLVRRISKKSIPVLTQPFERIPFSSQQTRRRTGGPKARNIQPLASLWSNARPKYRPRSRLSRPVVGLWQKRTKKRKTNKFPLAEYIMCHTIHTHSSTTHPCLFTVIYKTAHDRPVY